MRKKSWQYFQVRFKLYYEAKISHAKISFQWHFTVFPVKPWTPEKISGMFIVSQPIRCEMKPQKNRSRDQSRLDTKQRAGFFFYKKSSIFPLDLSEKAIFWPQTNTSHLIPSLQKPHYRIGLKVSVNCENLQRYRSASWVKVSQLQKVRIENHQSQLTSMTFWTVRETNTEKHRLWLAHFFVLSVALSSCVWSCLLDLTSLFRKMSCISILWWQQSWNRERKTSVFENSKIKDSSWKKKQARCFVSSRD